MDFLSSRDKDPLYAKYSTFPGWNSSHIYEHSPSAASYLQYLSDYGETLGARTRLDKKHIETSSTTRVPSQRKLSQRELHDYVDGVRNLTPKQRSDTRSYKERDLNAHCEGWESTWQTNWRGKQEHVGINSPQEPQAYANRYYHTLPKKTGFEVGDSRSTRCSPDIEKLLGCGQWAVETSERLQTTPLLKHKTDHSTREIENWTKWSPWDSRDIESIYSVESFRKPPSYTAPPAYSSPKDGYKLAGTPKVSAQAFPEQTFEKRNVTETHCNAAANNGQCLQNKNQNTECYSSHITGGQKQEALKTVSVMQYTAIKAKHSPQTKLQYPESAQMTCPDITQMKQTKPQRRKGGETVFCLVSRMGEVSGLSTSQEEPLKTHVLPLLTNLKPNNKTITTKQIDSPQCHDDSRQIRDEYLKRDEAGHGRTVEDQQSSSIQNLRKVINPDKNKQDLQWNDSQSGCLAQKSMQTDRHEKPRRETIEKFPLWKEPKYQSTSTGMIEQRNEQPQGIINESKVTNTEDSNNSTNDQQQSLVIIDATCVVVKVELVHLPEKEHVQYVCLSEVSPSVNQGNDQQKKHSSVLSTQETPENNTVGERAEAVLGTPDEHHGTVKGIGEDLDSSCDSHVLGSFKESDESLLEAGEVLENELMLGKPGSGTTSQNNDSLEEILNIIKVEDQTTAEPESVLEDLVLTNGKPTLEDCEVPTETTIICMKEIKERENRPTLDCANPETNQDDKIHQKYTPKDLAPDKTEDISDETDDQGEPVWDNFRKSTENSEENMDVVPPLTVGLRRSSSSPHLSFNSSVLNTPDVSYSEDEPWLLSPSINTEDSQCSRSPSIQSSCSSSLPSPPSSPIPDLLQYSSLPQTRNKPADVLFCTSEHKLKMPHAKSLRDAVSRIRKHTAPDSETEDEEECGDQTEGVSDVHKHTDPDSETEEEEECGDQTESVTCIHKHTDPDLETEEEEEVNEPVDQTEGVNCMYKHTAFRSETGEEEVEECGDQTKGVSHMCKHTTPDSEDEEVNESGDQTEGQSSRHKHAAPESKTEEEEVTECGDCHEEGTDSLHQSLNKEQE